MLKAFDISENIQPSLEEIEDRVTDAYSDGTHQSEERITGFLSGLLATELDDSFSAGSNRVRIKVGAYEARDEPESGVDMGMRYQLVTEDFRLSTGMLIQSKRVGNHDIHLPNQCYKMLVRTQEAYIFAYSQDRIEVFPAVPIYRDGGTGGKFTKYYQVEFVTFLSRFLEGFHGDLRISETVDQPAEAFPVPERVKYLVDIKAAVNQDEPGFARVERDHFTRMRQDERY
jgi:hypothetical protein